jgi:hypothetical protein
VVHRLPEILRGRFFAIACGCEDADDLDRLRSTRPITSLADARDSGHDLCTRPAMSRWENAPNVREIMRLMG